MDHKHIVWLSSYPKSGNTWLRCFLDAYIMGSININEIVSSISDDNAAAYLPGDGSDPSTFPVDVQILTRPMGLLRMVRRYQEERINGLQVPLFIKTHTSHLLTNGIEHLPSALTKAVIYLVRDPRDVLISFSKHMGVDLDTGLDYMLDKYRHLADSRRAKMADCISSWPMAVASYANADSHNVRIWRYEDMKAEPHRVFSEILTHAGIKPDPERVQTAIDAVELSKLQRQEQEKGFREASPHNPQFFGQGKTGGWREVINLRQLFRLEKACKSMMKRFGYKASTVRAVS